MANFHAWGWDIEGAGFGSGIGVKMVIWADLAFGKLLLGFFSNFARLDL